MIMISKLQKKYAVMILISQMDDIKNDHIAPAVAVAVDDENYIDK